MKEIEICAKLMLKCKRAVVFTGAGVSKESGIPTFRGKDGLWKKYRVEDLATNDAFMRNPKLVWEWYDERRRWIKSAKPNPGHIAIKDLEEFFEELVVITQNVDGLHQRAKSSKVIELHGNIWRVKCIEEHKKFYLNDVPLNEIPPKCECGGLLRPDVVWFGEPMPFKETTESFELSRKCDLMLVVGTSGVVYPAAQLPYIAKECGAKVIEVNVEYTPISTISDITLSGASEKILPLIVEAMRKMVGKTQTESGDI